MSTTTPDCWVQFWENKNYGSGGTHTFRYTQPDDQPAHQPLSINDLSEYYWDGYSASFKNQMDDSISSLKTGSHTWLYVFSKHRQGGNVLKIGPNSELKDLSHKNNPDGSTWQNTIVSFVLYDQQPTCWDTSRPTLAADCWLKLYAGKRYTDTCFTLVGAGAVVNLICLDGYRYWVDKNAEGNTIHDYRYRNPNSLTTGPGTWVVLYDDTSFDNEVASFGPNSLVADLLAYTRATITSLKVSASAPAGFSQSTKIPPLVATIQRYQTAAKLEGVLSGVVGLVPEIGGVFSLLLDALWPSGPSTAEVWYDLTAYTEAMMQGLLDQAALKELDKKLYTYRDDISYYNELPNGISKAEQLRHILYLLDDNKVYFLDKSQPEHTLTYLLAFGTISVLMLAERVYNYDILSTPAADAPPADDAASANYSPPTSADNDEMRRKLETDIKVLTEAVRQAIAGAVDWRANLITLTDTGGLQTNYLVADSYTGSTVQYTRQADATAAQQQQQAFVRRQYEAQLQAYAIPAGLWGYLTPANTQPGENPGHAGNPGAVAFPTIAFRRVPSPQTVSVAVPTTAGPLASPTLHADLSTGTLAQVSLYAADGLSAHGLIGLKFEFADGRVAALGQTGGPAVVSVALDPDVQEGLVALYGGSSSQIDQLYFRTSAGRDFGLGGSGGSAFFGAAPQGVAARLVAVAGTTTASGYLRDLAFTWQYQTATPYPL